ncbi:FAD-dependent oxidoreductase [Kineosporia sp. J2-2]|uniref:FAD-dependent oxidoreductase n=1 Tax=Kineosporia corallincola TaxID=2835133 RepID=A0ABS5TBU3_9ACTN|nr:FAD-dependent oxidoreductase [Kineosporia corallincola]MBT0768308.1 FAD-dependent oxidoreductase [Kineosporia corallincola]
MSVAVIGAGVVGLATTAALLERGADVVCYEQGAAVMGERSAGDSRIFRYAHRAPELVIAAGHSRRLFTGWERRAGRQLVEPAGTVISGPTEQDVLPWARAMASAGAPFTVSFEDDDRPRLPAARLPEHFLADPAGGVIRVDRVREFLSRICAPAVRTAAVSGLEETSDGVLVRTRDGDCGGRFETVVLAAGAGTSALAAQVGLDAPAALTHHARFTFPLREQAPAGPPAWITRTAGGLSTYQHSSTPGHWAVGLELGASATRWEVGRTAALEAARAATLDYVRAELEHVEPRIVDEIYCTPYADLDDGIHYLRRDRTIAVYGENLFKFAPLIGEQLAGAVLDGVVPSSID